MPCANIYLSYTVKKSCVLFDFIAHLSVATVCSTVCDSSNRSCVKARSVLVASLERPWSCLYHVLIFSSLFRQCSAHQIYILMNFGQLLHSYVTLDLRRQVIWKNNHDYMSFLIEHTKTLRAKSSLEWQVLDSANNFHVRITYLFNLLTLAKLVIYSKCDAFLSGHN
jgi:hypothetical protein